MNKLTFIFAIFLLILLNGKCFSQIGINTGSPRSTLDVKSSNPSNPKNNEGVIIPRVTSLNTSGIKEKGLLVFLDAENPATQAIEKGFYFWDGVKWVALFAMNQEISNRTIVFANLKNNFDEGAYTLSTSESDTRNLGFLAGSVKPASAAAAYTVNSNGELIIGKKGYYDISGIITMRAVSTDVYRRDTYEFSLLKNGGATNIKTVNGFPALTLGAGTQSSDTTVGSIMAGVLYLNQNDRLKIQIFRSNEGVTGGSGTTQTTSPIQESSTVTLRYMGDF